MDAAAQSDRGRQQLLRLVDKMLRLRDLSHCSCPPIDLASDICGAESPKELSISPAQAGRILTPSSVSPVVTKRHNSISSLRAMATISDFRVP